MRFSSATRRIAGAAAGLALACGLTFGQPVPARAQGGIAPTVMIAMYDVEPEHHAEFNGWIAEFRSIVEKLIEDGKLSETDQCAYWTWRVLGPSGDSNRYLFVFDPVIPMANYLLIDHLTAGLGREEAIARMGRFAAMTKGQLPTMIHTAPLDAEVDAVDRSDVCDS